MGKEYTIIVDTADCIGCSACVVACKQTHNLPVGPKWIKVNLEAPRIIDGKKQIRYTVTHCLHCSHPKCAEACPVNAITKRTDGIVLIDDKLCIGCQACIDACPIGAMQFDDDKNIAQKCNLCSESIDTGLKPACVNACPSHCIYFGDLSEVTDKIGKHKLLTTYKDISQ